MKQLGQEQVDLVLNQLANLEERFTGADFIRLWKQISGWIKAGQQECLIKLLQDYQDSLPVARAFLLVIFSENDEYEAADEQYDCLLEKLSLHFQFWYILRLYLRSKRFLELESSLGNN